MKKWQNTKQNKVNGKSQRMWMLQSLQSLHSDRWLPCSNKRCSSAGGLNTSPAGAVTSLILMAVFGGLIINSDVHAEPSILTLSIDSNTISVDIASLSTSGTFAQSEGSTISAWTNNATGYTLKLVSSNVVDNANKYLVNTSDSNEHLTSIGTTTTKNNFTSGEWGYLPSQYYNTTTGETIDNTVSTTNGNPNFLPAPDATGDTLALTNIANTGTAADGSDTYTIALGAKVDASTKMGTYQNTAFVVQLVSNAVPYSIIYKDNAVSNMPANVTGTADSGTDVTISGSTPTRDGYTFNGWCNVTPTINSDGIDTCTGTTYIAGGNIPISGTSANEFTLYAMWKDNYSINNVSTMQEFATMDTTKKARIVSSMPIGQQYQLTDTRDNTKYWIARQADGKVWMTQNLDLCVGCTGVAALTSENTDLNTYDTVSGGVYYTNYSMSGGVITWNPQPTTGTDYASPITSAQVIDYPNGSATWPGSYVYPWSAEAGERYYYTSGDTSNDTASTTCNNGGNGTDWCKHYHAGNYYNWTEAIASSNSTNISVQYAVAENSICPAGWRLPRGRSSSAPAASTMEFGWLLYISGVTDNIDVDTYVAGGFNLIRKSPLFLVRSGDINNGLFRYGGTVGESWTSTVYSDAKIYALYFANSNAYMALDTTRSVGRSVRCLLR